MLRFACIVIMLFGFKATFTDAQTVKTISVYQYVKDSFTKVGIPNAKVTLLDETRTVIDTMRTRGSNGYWDRELERTPRKYIVRVEHPDYETGGDECRVEESASQQVFGTFHPAYEKTVRSRRGRCYGLNS